MASQSVDEIYDRMIRSLLARDRLRLVEKIVHDLSSSPEEALQRYDWMGVRGIAPNLLEGEDAQTWVSRSRREADERRARQQGPAR